VLTIGTFDGVHIGHQKIINRLNKIADEIGGESVLLTFYPHPRKVLFPDDDKIKLIQSQDEKLDKLTRCGVKNIVIQEFTKEFSRQPALHFIRDFLVNQLGAEKIVIGYDHRFGKNREGTLEHFQELAPLYHFSVEEIPAQEIDEVNVSSTKIRNALLNGEIAMANTYLNEPFQLNGIIVSGKKIGRTIGYPTANLSVEDDCKIIPKIGIYAVRCSFEGGVHFGMMSIGYNPTVNPEIPEKPILEIHIFNFEGKLYGKKMCVEILEYIREERKFDSLDKLKNALKDDENIARSIVTKYSFGKYTL
jgi:riboflavin kinase/FMN adenylyltransferase